MNPIRIAPIVLTALFVGCGTAPVSYGEASEALTEASNESQAIALASNTIEISTNFTIGMGVQHAVDELKQFVQTELPCATVTLQGATLTVQYGTQGTQGMCLWHGQKITGTHAITVSKADDTVEVTHAWTEIKNDKVSLTGTATVTWSKTDKSRHIVYALDFTRLSDSVKASGSGDVTQKILDETMALSSPENGLQLDGTQSWTGPKGTWKLTIDGVKFRWKDPLPFIGSYAVETPASKIVTLTFERVDETTIEATLEGGRKTYHFKVHSNGAVEDSTS